MRDRYFSLVYWWQGKTVTEGVGWASDGWTPGGCFDLLADLKRNQKKGGGPCTLAEMREDSEAEKAVKRKAREAEARRNVSFRAFFDDVFMPDAETRWKPETARKAREHVATWIDHVTGTTPFRELGLPHVQRIRADMAKAGRSARTQQYVFRTFSMVWNAARDHGLVSGPCPTKSGSFRLPKVDNERQRYLTAEEENRLFEACMARGRQVHDMAMVALDAGLRFSEVAALAWGCVDLENGVLHVLHTKSGKDRDVPMTARLVEMFTALKAGKPSDLVFPSRLGTVHGQVPGAFKQAIKDAGLNEGVADPKMRASFHTLRHTYASRLVQAGVDLYRVQRLMGHSTPVMTARYSKLADDDLRQAVQAMERDAVARKSNGKVLPLKRGRGA
ncbi:MAG: site-specific integrase [Desulfovibrionaceae bacterium]|nr:site-specific integrase [Desulfovibrionaceae bacterium]